MEAESERGLKHERAVADVLSLMQDVVDEQRIQVSDVVQIQSVGRRLALLYKKTTFHFVFSIVIL